MPGAPTLSTSRLVLRRWRPADRDPFASINGDPAVMEHFAAPLSRRESDELIERIESQFAEHDLGLWALELRARGELVGFTGLMPVPFEEHFTPAVEVGWRLARFAWGRGYATEAAVASVTDGFQRLGLTEVVSYTVPANVRSRAVMQRLGMHHDPAEDFDHPRLAPSSELRRHVLYRLRRDDWRDPPVAR